MVTIIGMGAVGSAVARRLRQSGHEVSEGAPLVLMTLPDHDVMHQRLARLDADLSGRTIVGIVTGTPDQARLTARRVTDRGGHYLDAGLQSSPATIDSGIATIRYSGPRSAYEHHRATLALLGEPHFAGEAPEAAAIWDLTLFGIWYDAQLGLLRALDTAHAAGIDLDEFGRNAQTQLGHVVSAVSGTVDELRQQQFPRGPANLTEHLRVVRHLLELRTGQPLGSGGLPEVAARLEALIATGRGDEGLTAAA